MYKYMRVAFASEVIDKLSTNTKKYAISTICIGIAQFAINYTSSCNQDLNAMIWFASIEKWVIL